MNTSILAVLSSSSANAEATGSNPLFFWGGGGGGGGGAISQLVKLGFTAMVTYSFQSKIC